MPKNFHPWYYSGLAFSCRQCGRCCAGPEEGYVWVNTQECHAIAEYLNLSPDQVKEKYMRRVGLRYSLREKETGKDCVFLSRTEDNKSLCEIYPVRPLQCRTWPFWTDNLRSQRDWEEISRSCPGLDRDQWYSYDRIEAIRAGNSDLHIPDATLPQAVWNWIRTNLGKSAYLAAVEQLYQIIDQHLSGAESDCSVCGRCCRFDQFDHRLYVTTLEMLYLVHGIEKLNLTVPKISDSRCPFQKDNQCTLRTLRPSGCRIFFCRGLDKNYQHELTEEILRQLRRFHMDFNAVYYYADLLDWLDGYHRYGIRQS
jgi:uncharacterized protein